MVLHRACNFISSGQQVEDGNPQCSRICISLIANEIAHIFKGSGASRVLVEIPVQVFYPISCCIFYWSLSVLRKSLYI